MVAEHEFVELGVTGGLFVVVGFHGRVERCFGLVDSDYGLFCGCFSGYRDSCLVLRERFNCGGHFGLGCFDPGDCFGVVDNCADCCVTNIGTVVAGIFHDDDCGIRGFDHGFDRGFDIHGDGHAVTRWLFHYVFQCVILSVSGEMEAGNTFRADTLGAPKGRSTTPRVGYLCSPLPWAKLPMPSNASQNDTPGTIRKDAIMAVKNSEVATQESRDGFVVIPQEAFNVAPLSSIPMPETWEDAMAFAESVAHISTSSEDLPDEWPEVDKEKLVNVPFFIVAWTISDPADMEYGQQYVVVRGITRMHQRFRFTDGSTGIYAQLRRLTAQRLKREDAAPYANSGLVCENGLTKSEYTKNVNGQPTRAVTYYIQP